VRGCLLSSDALIVENELFEKAVMRIARSLPLSEEQEALVVPLIKEESPPVEPVEASSSTSKEHGAHNNEDEISYSEELQRKLKGQRTEVQADKAKSYINLDALLPETSVNCFYVFVIDEWLLHRRLLCSSLFSVKSSINKDKGEGDMTRNAPYCRFPLPYCSIVRTVQYYSYFLHLPH
jgi:hypothetical protein